MHTPLSPTTTQTGAAEEAGLAPPKLGQELLHNVNLLVDLCESGLYGLDRCVGVGMCVSVCDCGECQGERRRGSPRTHIQTHTSREGHAMYVSHPGHKHTKYRRLKQEQTRVEELGHRVRELGKRVEEGEYLPVWVGRVV